MKRFLGILMLLWVVPILAGDLKQSTAIQVPVWFFDASTGAPKTGITVTSVTCETVKQDMTAASFNPTASGGSHDMVEIANGAYRLELTASDTDTVGIFDLSCQISGSTSPPTEYTIKHAASYAATVEGDNASLADFWAQATSGFTTSGSVGKLLVDNLNTPTSEIINSPMTELTATPSSDPTLQQAIMMVYMALRNQLTVTATKKTIFNDAGTAISHKNLSSAAGTFTETKAADGP